MHGVVQTVVSIIITIYGPLGVLYAERPLCFAMVSFRNPFHAMLTYTHATILYDTKIRKVLVSVNWIDYFQYHISRQIKRQQGKQKTSKTPVENDGWGQITHLRFKTRTRVWNIFLSPHKSTWVMVLWKPDDDRRSNDRVRVSEKLGLYGIGDRLGAIWPSCCCYEWYR